jgi:hypothetical protein
MKNNARKKHTIKLEVNDRKLRIVLPAAQTVYIYVDTRDPERPTALINVAVLNATIHFVIVI